jgi:cell division protein FtsW (lipid II flippase)
MSRARVSVLLLVLPALALGALCLTIVATGTARTGAPGLGAASHFAGRQLVGLALGLALGVLAARAGGERILRAAPVLFVAALVATAAVFVPGVGVRAAGASRWLKLGPFSGSPAPFLIGATALLVAAWSERSDRGARRSHPIASRPTALALALIALLVLVAEPDFSAAAVVLAVAFAALGGGGVASRRLIPAALLLLLALAAGASRFGYVNKRVDGFMSPKSDRRGKGFEVLALARANAGAAAGGTGLGNSSARRHLSSPASDYVFAVVGEELGRKGMWGVVGAWVLLAAGAAMAARSAGSDPRLRAAAAACAAALLTPAALHVAVCRGWTPIVGVTMPFLSYDPALTVASGGELGVLAAIALATGPAPASSGEAAA